MKMNVNIFAKANENILACDAAYIGVTDGDGRPSVSTVSVLAGDEKFLTRNIFCAYFSAGMNGNKTKRLLKNKNASVCFRNGGNNITLVGEAEILTGREIKSRLWEDWEITHFPQGETDPNYCIIKFTTKRVSLWIDNESAEFTVDELMKVQSRCGLLCDGCSYKASHGCAGCIAQNGKPFHGECDVALCCQKKGFNHCGECPEVPCGALKNYSCGDGDECDRPKGARISVCKAWALLQR